VALTVFVALRSFLKYSSVGRQIVAVSHHREVSTALGINVKRVSLLTFVVGSILGALAGALASPTVSWVPGIGGEMIVLSFAVVATAGLGQIEGALVAAILIGLARSFAVYLLPEIEVLMPFLIMVLVLLFRPQGLFSVATARRV
jgi:branched-chain amino acid transport system permease protein